MFTELAFAGLAAGLSAGGCAYAASWPTSQIFGRTIVSGRDPKEIALTYDDGPNGSYTLRLLEILARHETRATFFLIGRFVRQQPEIARAIREAGHLVGNHTMTHPALLWAQPRRVRQQLKECSAAIEDATGERVHYFRPPFGARRPDVLHIARELGLTPVMWNITSQDWRVPPQEELIRRITKSMQRNQRQARGSNILMHDGGHAQVGIDRSPTLAATSHLLNAYGEDMRWVTVDEWAK